MLLDSEYVFLPLVSYVRTSVEQGTPLQGPLQGETGGGLAAAAAAGGLSFEVVSSGSGSDGGDDDGGTPS